MVGPLWTLFRENYLASILKSSVWAAVILIVRGKVVLSSWLLLTAILSQIHLLLEKWAPQILTSYSTALSWHSGARIGMEGFEAKKALKKCATCPKPKQYRLSQMLPVVQIAEAVGLSTPTISTSDTKSNGLPVPVPEKIDKPSMVKVDRVSAGKCAALNQAGFRSTWTWQDVKQLPRSEIEKIHQSASKMAGTTINLNDVVACYPNYLAKCGPIKQKKIQKPKPKMQTKEPPVKTPVKSCDWKSFQKHLKETVAAHYQKVYLVMSDQEKQMFEKRRGDLISFTTQKALIEIQSLIYRFQHKSQESWKNHLGQLKMKSGDGYLIQGTSYLVPWSTFDKFTGCFGSSQKEGFGGKVRRRGWFSWW